MVRAAVLLVVLVGFVAAQEPKKPEVVGIWTVVSAIKGGEKPPEEVLKAMLVTFDDKTVSIKDGERTDKAPYKVDAAAKPKTIDVMPEKAPQGTVVPGIYELNGDDLKVSWSKGGVRPKDFKGEGDDVILFVLKRKK